MRSKVVWQIVSYLMVAILMLTSCTSAITEEEEEEREEVAPPTSAPTPTTALEIDGIPPPAIETIEYGQSYGSIKLLSSNYNLEVIIPPAKTHTAPFDTDVLPDGRIVMGGNGNRLVSVSLQGEIVETEYLFTGGCHFESDNSGTMWYYFDGAGVFSYWKVGMHRAEDIATLPAHWGTASISVSPDGTAVYIGWAHEDYKNNLYKSAIYRYTEGKGMEKLVERTSPSETILAVEVTPKGNVFVACKDGIYSLTSTNQLELVYDLIGVLVPNDGMTSDENDNLYFSQYGLPHGVYKLTPEGTLKTVVTVGTVREVPFGLSWDRQHQLIIGARKERGEIVAIDMDGTMTVLNDPSSLSTPIPVKEHPDGTIFVNGDEAGLLMVDGSGTVHSLDTRGMDFVSFQPPAADFCFDSDGLIYYSFAAPGFDSMIVTVDQDGRVNKVTEDVGKPAGIDIDTDGVIYYADYERSAVYTLTDQGESICIADNIPHPIGLVIDSENNFWVGAAAEDIECDPLSVGRSYCLNTRILRFREGESPEEVFNSHNVRHPNGITFFDVDEEGNLYIPFGDRLLLRSPDDRITEIAEGFNLIRGAQVVKDGRIYISDYEAGTLYRLVPLLE